MAAVSHQPNTLLWLLAVAAERLCIRKLISARQESHPPVLSIRRPRILSYFQ
jgi:hypothetical protein